MTTEPTQEALAIVELAEVVKDILRILSKDLATSSPLRERLQASYDKATRAKSRVAV